jgi:hypothetical protein
MDRFVAFAPRIDGVGPQTLRSRGFRLTASLFYILTVIVKFVK